MLQPIILIEKVFRIPEFEQKNTQSFIKMRKKMVPLNHTLAKQAVFHACVRRSGESASLQRVPRWGPLDPFELYQPCSYPAATHIVQRSWTSKTRRQKMRNILDLTVLVGHVARSQENNLWPHVIRRFLRQLGEERVF